VCPIGGREKSKLRIPLRHIWSALVLTISAGAHPAAAQVYELGDAGAVTIRDGGGAVQWLDLDQQAAALAEQPRVQAIADLADLAGLKAPQHYVPALLAASQRSGLPVKLIDAVAWQESRWQQSAVSPKGARGLMQLMPETANDLGVNSYDANANLVGGAMYLRSMLDMFGGDLSLALAAYNAGAMRVRKAGGIPAIRETREYVAAILGRLSLPSPGTA
jgi:soluble lytic murein transglycosylase-like protein